MISYTVDSEVYHGMRSSPSAVGAELVYFVEPFTPVKVITRQTRTNDGWASSFKVAPVSGTGTDVIYLKGGLFSAAGSSGLNLDAYLAALVALKNAYGTGSSIDMTPYKTAAIALDVARDSAMGAFRTSMGFMDSTNQEYFGRIYAASMPYPRAVRIYEYHSGELVDTSYPDSTGMFSFSGLAVGKYYLTAHDFDKLNADKNPIIKTVTIS